MARSFHIGPWTVEPDLNAVVQNGKTAHLEPKAMEVLLRLAASAGHTVSKDEIIRSVWPDTFVGDDALSRAVYEIRKAFDDDPHQPQFIQTIPKRGYRIVAEVEVLDESPRTDGPVVEPQAQRGRLVRRWKIVAGIIAVVVIVAATATFYIYSRTKALTEKDEILLADFVNTTGEPIFDSTLKTALAVKLGESPFLNTVSETRAQQALKMMEKPEGEKLLGGTAREACQRLNVKALLNSSIGRLGGDYLITLEAMNCQTGEVIAREQAQAQGQGKVLDALGRATSKLRTQLGESIKSVQRFDTPLEQATTTSLQALQAYSLGWQRMNRGGWGNLEAVRFFERAVELDPDFALAYQSMGACYFNLGEVERSRTYSMKAFALRERPSERERFQITAWYYGVHERDLGKAVPALQLYKQSYPRDPRPYHMLGNLYLYDLGSPDKALEENRKALELAPDSTILLGNVAWNLIAMNRYDEAAVVLDRAAQTNFSAWSLNQARYPLAFVRNDRNAMAHLVENTKGSVTMLSLEARTTAFGGRLQRARSFYRQAVNLGRAAGIPQLSDMILEHEALVEAEIGNAVEAKALLRQCRHRSGLTALVLARTGETTQAETIADDIGKRFPSATMVQNMELPLIRAAIALDHGRPDNAADAIQPALAHELATAWCGWWVSCNPDVLYMISQTYLAQGDAAQATASFQKLLDHRGLYPTSPVYPLAYVGLARARTLAGDTAGARKAYEQFFAIWKHADPDIPILRQATAEYGKLGL